MIAIGNTFVQHIKDGLKTHLQTIRLYNFEVSVEKVEKKSLTRQNMSIDNIRCLVHQMVPSRLNNIIFVSHKIVSYAHSTMGKTKFHKTYTVLSVKLHIGENQKYPVRMNKMTARRSERK